MNLYDAIILGAIQGLAEFLPISSSGHLLLIQRWLGISEGTMFFNVMLHIGTLIPVFIVLFRDILSLFQKPCKKLLFLIIATIPAGLTGMLLGDLVDSAFAGSTWLSAGLLAGMFLITAVELLVSELVYKKRKKSLPLNFANTTVMGLAQGVAIVPGLSRSGTVMSAGALMGLDKEENASFTFLMSIPVILGAAVVTGYKALSSGGISLGLPIIAGMLTAAITGYCAITFMLRLIKNVNYKWFSLYLLFAAASSIISFAVFGV